MNMPKAERFVFYDGSLMGGDVHKKLSNGVTQAHYTGSEWLPVDENEPSAYPVYQVFVGTEDEFFSQADESEIVEVEE